MCPKCGRPVADCSCRADKAAAKGDGNVKVSRETKGRGGKCVTLISGLPLDEQGLSSLAKQLKQRCGCGGTVKEGIVEIQGDHRDTLVEELTKRGFKVKRAGG